MAGGVQGLMLLQGHHLPPNTNDGHCPDTWSLLMSPGTAFNGIPTFCRSHTCPPSPSVPPHSSHLRLPVAQSKSPEVQLSLSCSTRVVGWAMPAPGPFCTRLFSPPLSFLHSPHSRVWGWCFQDAVSPETLERGGRGSIPTASGGWWVLLPAACPQSPAGERPPLPPCPRSLPQTLCLTDAGTELIGSQPANDSHQLSPGSFPTLAFSHINECQRIPEKSRQHQR